MRPSTLEDARVCQADDGGRREARRRRLGDGRGAKPKAPRRREGEDGGEEGSAAQDRGPAQREVGGCRGEAGEDNRNRARSVERAAEDGHQRARGPEWKRQPTRAARVELGGAGERLGNRDAREVVVRDVIEVGDADSYACSEVQACDEDRV